MWRSTGNRYPMLGTSSFLWNSTYNTKLFHRRILSNCFESHIFQCLNGLRQQNDIQVIVLLPLSRYLTTKYNHVIVLSNNLNQFWRCSIQNVWGLMYNKWNFLIIIYILYSFSFKEKAYIDKLCSVLTCASR